MKLKSIDLFICKTLNYAIIDNCIQCMVLKYIHGSFGQYYQTWLYEADVIWRIYINWYDRNG